MFEFQICPLTIAVRRLPHITILELLFEAQHDFEILGMANQCDGVCLLILNPFVEGVDTPPQGQPSLQQSLIRGDLGETVQLN